MTILRALLLDTNHISDIACDPSGAAAAVVIRRLQREDACLAISLFQILEVASPAFSGVGEVKALLRDVPTVLCNPFEDVQEEEMSCAVARAIGIERRPPRVFARDTSEWGYKTGPMGGTASNMIETFADLQDERKAILEMARIGAEASMMKREAALAREPMLPLTLALGDHLRARRTTCAEYGGGLSPQQILDRVGGKLAFPGYQVQEALVAERMNLPEQKSTPNDVLDEFIAFHSPYAAVTALDKRTVHRARMAKLPHVERMTRYLADIPVILDRVLSGDLVPLESAW